MTKSILTTLLLCIVGCAVPSRAESVSGEAKPLPPVQLDLYEAALRWYLTQYPLSRHQDLYVILNDGLVQGLPARFQDYRVIVRSGSRGQSPRHARWYWLHLGRVTSDKAFVLVETAAPGGTEALELGKRGDRWFVHSEHPFILVSHKRD